MAATAFFEPKVVETPDSTRGGEAVSGATLTGHASTNSAASRSSAGTTVTTKTCRWFNFGVFEQSLITAITLTFKWQAIGNAIATNGGGANADAVMEFIVGVSADGGNTWRNKVSQARTVTANNETSEVFSVSGSEEIAFRPSTPINLIQLRDGIRATATISGAASADASITVTVSDIRLRVRIRDTP